MIIYRPIQTDYITQGFGENKACINDNGKVLTKKEICPKDFYDFYLAMNMKGHNGIDLIAWHGEPVYHSADFSGWLHLESDMAGGLGADVVSYEPILWCEECKENHYCKIRYWHNSDLVGFEKADIKSGDLIAFAGSTGASSGVHVHHALKWCDKDGHAIHDDNGYMGAIDYTSFYENKFILDVLQKNYQMNIWDEIKSVLILIKIRILKWKKL